MLSCYQQSDLKVIIFFNLRSCFQATIISEVLKEVFSELSDTSASDTVVIKMSTESPFLQLIAGNDGGTFVVDFPEKTDVTANFLCTRNIECNYNRNLLQQVFNLLNCPC